MLRIEGLTVRYGSFLAVDDLGLQVDKGAIVGVIGPNGAGKSSVLNAVAGLLHAQGSIVVDGSPVGAEAPEARLQRGIVLVPEYRGIFPMMSVRENLQIGAYRCRDAAERRRRLDHVLSLFPILGTRSAQMVGTMSGGQQQMVAIGSGLMAGPRLLMLDEPSIGLAPIVIQEIGQTLLRLRAEGLTILLSEQNAKLATTIADSLYVMQAGRIQAMRTTASLKDDPAFVEAYLSLG